jgi:cytochrome P450
LKRAVVTGQRIFYIDSLHKRYGPIVRLSPTEVGVADLEAFKEIHKIGTKYMKSEWYLRLANFPKAGVFTMLDPREHGPRRKLLSRSFSRTYLVENWESVVREKALLAVTKIKADAVQNTADVYNWWMLLASDVSAHLAFGDSFRMLEMGHVGFYSEVCLHQANTCSGEPVHPCPEKAHYGSGYHGRDALSSPSSVRSH